MNLTIVTDQTLLDWDKTHPMLAGRMGLGVLGIEFLGLKGMFVGPKSIEFQNRAFNDYSPKTYTKELKTRYTKEHEGLEVMPTRTQIGQEKKLYKTELKKLMMKINRYKESGQEVPQSLRNQVIGLREQFKERVQKIKSGEQEKGAPFAYPFMNILGDRKGLDVSAEDFELDEE
jgi:hypothetical protein